MKYSILVLAFLIMASTQGRCQILQPVTWSVTMPEEGKTTGKETELVFQASIDEGWYLYSSDFDADLGPQVTEFDFLPHTTYKLIGDIRPIGAKAKYDSLWQGTYTYFTGTAEFRQKIEVVSLDFEIAGTYRYQVCSSEDGRCIPFEEEFKFPKQNKPELSKPEQSKKDDRTPYTTGVSSDFMNQKSSGSLSYTQDASEVSVERGGTTSLWVFMALAFLGGMAALFTPCIFPMVPMTVTFFTSRTPNRKQAVMKAAIYGISIILIYVIAGTLVAVINGPGFANWLSTHWLPNVFFFLVFITFGLSFLGLFEITLPSGFVNKVDRQADKKGYYGVFFMAFTLVLVSFSCTGPIVGSILVEAAGGVVLKPVLGMLAFSMAFAIPFTLFAIFPEWLNSLPKSGSWLNSVKVVLGFLELALGLKFLSVADQVYRWGILDREVYLVIWIVIFFFLGLYLLGKIRLPHEKSAETIRVPRLVLAVMAFSFTLYLVPGLFGAPLKAMAGYLPPMSTHDFNLAKMFREPVHAGVADNNNSAGLCEQPDFNELFELPHGLSGYFDFDQAVACAQELQKPLFIDFTGHGCVNCREMEARVWGDQDVLRILKRDYIVVALYVDDKTTLPKKEWFQSTFDGRLKTTIGSQNADLQITRFNNNAQPYYAILDPTTQELLVEPRGYDLEVENFVRFLQEGKERLR